MEFVQCGLEMLDVEVVRSVSGRRSDRKSGDDVLVGKWTLGGGRFLLGIAK